MKKIIYTRPDGGLSVVHPVINTHTVVNGEVVPLPENISEEQALARALKKLPASARNPQVVDESAIPADRTFRDAWTAGSGAVLHDMDKCRAIHRDYLRKLRKPQLEALDIALMHALETGASIFEITTKKQALRDVTADPAIDAAKTPEELKAVLPAVLKS